MKIAFWDTYVKRNDGKMMHFDILVEEHVTDSAKVFEYGNHYLKTNGFSTYELTSNECCFCHIEPASEEVIKDIQNKGYAINEMYNCH